MPEGNRLRVAAQRRAWQRGTISFATFDASVQGWINHVRYADSWGLRQQVLDRFDLTGQSAAAILNSTVVSIKR